MGPGFPGREWTLGPRVLLSGSLSGPARSPLPRAHRQRLPTTAPTSAGGPGGPGEGAAWQGSCPPAAAGSASLGRCRLTLALLVGIRQDPPCAAVPLTCSALASPSPSSVALSVPGLGRGGACDAFPARAGLQ